MADDSRAKMIAAAAGLLASRGANRTSFADVIAASGAPRGSIYHHFPDGKRQLILEVVAATGRWLLARQGQAQPSTPQEVLDTFVDIWRQVVLGTSATGGCAVAGAAVDSSVEDEAGAETLSAVRAVFESWIDLLSEQFQASGIPEQQAPALATTVLAALEGALVLCRAHGTAQPLETVAVQLSRLVSDPRPGG